MSDKDVQTAVRVSADVIKRLDAWAQQMEATTPGLKITRSDAMRIAIENGLKVMKTKAAKPAKKAG